MGDLTQLLDRRVDALTDVVEHLVQQRVIAGQVSRKREPYAHRHQAVLDPVMEIALQHLPLPVEGVDDTDQRPAGVGEAAAGAPSEPLGALIADDRPERLRHDAPALGASALSRTTVAGFSTEIGGAPRSCGWTVTVMLIGQVAACGAVELKELPMSDPERSTEAPKRVHRFVVPILLVLASLALFTGAFAVWVHRQALNSDNWEATSSQLLADKQVQAALGPYLVDQLFTNVDVTGAIEERLPSDLQVLAGPAAAGLRQLADRAAPKVLAKPRVQDAWVTANATAHDQLLKILNGGGPVVSTTGGVVTLDLHELVDQLAAQLGVSSQVASARTKLQGPVGEEAKAQLQQRLDLNVPDTSGQLVIMRSDELKTAQDIATTVNGLAIVLPALAILLFALAIWLARGRRRQALRSAGWCFVVVGVLLLLVRRIGGNEIVDSLVKVPENEPAVHQVWTIATSLLFAIAVALIVYGIVFALAAWLGGPTRPARFLRKLAAPELRESPAMAYTAAGGLLLALVIWGPTPAFRQLAWILLFAALLALGVTVLRRQTAVEFPGVQRGDAVRELRERWEAARARRSATSHKVPAGPAPTQVLDELERLAALHDSGGLSDTEFAAAKTRVMNGS